MNIIEDFITDYYTLIIIGIVAVIIIMFFTIVSLNSKIQKIRKRHKKLLRGVNGANLEEVIDNYYDKIEYQMQENDLIKEKMKNIEKSAAQCIQKISFKRYRAFEDVGSDLSFSLALLDKKNDGVVITSLYSRSESTVYGKAIQNGKSKYDLSQEEIDVLEGAIKKDQ